MRPTPSWQRADSSLAGGLIHLPFGGIPGRSAGQAGTAWLSLIILAVAGVVLLWFQTFAVLDVAKLHFNLRYPDVIGGRNSVPRAIGNETECICIIRMLS